jgi:hypothetical protein
MAIKAELPDGTILEFPEGTPDDVIDNAVKQQLGGAQPQDESFLRALYLGAREPLDIAAARLEQLPGVGGISRLGAALGLPTAQQALRETDIQRRQNVSGAGQILGNIAGTAAMLPVRAVTAPATIGQAAVGGGLASSLLSRAEDIPSFVGDVASGAAISGALKPVADIVAGTIAPTVSRGIRTLRQEGISPTLGMIVGEGGSLLGRGVQKLEEAATSLPGIGDIVQAAREQVGEEFERAALNRASSFIGRVVPKDLEGEQAVGWVKGKLQQAYNTLVPNLEFNVTKDFGQRARQVFDDLGIPSSRKNLQRDWLAIIKDSITDLADTEGMIKGKNLQDALSRLGKSSEAFMKSADPFERRLGVGTANLRQAWMEALAEQNPAQAVALRQINAGWAHQARLKKAASGAQGKITPSSLDRAVSAFGKGERRGPYADLGRAGRNIPSRTPDSGTATRLARNLALTGGLAAGGQGIAEALGYEGITPQQASAIALIAAPYTPQGRKAIAAILGRQPSKASQAVGVASRALLSPAAAAGLITPRQGNR